MACILWPQPEQNSQANRTWSNIVGDTTRQHFSAVLDSQTAEDYIPLETSVNTCDVLDKTGSKDGKPLKRKLQHIEKSQHINRHVSTSLFNMPWKNKNYVQDPTGYGFLFSSVNSFKLVWKQIIAVLLQAKRGSSGLLKLYKTEAGRGCCSQRCYSEIWMCYKTTVASSEGWIVHKKYVLIL